MVQTIDVDKIRTGWTAFDVRGEKIGDVAEIGSDYVLVVKGLFLPTDLYIPLARVTTLDEAQSTFEVNVPKEKVEAMGWTNPPADGGWEVSGAADNLAMSRCAMNTPTRCAATSTPTTTDARSQLRRKRSRPLRLPNSRAVWSCKRGGPRRGLPAAVGRVKPWPDRRAQPNWEFTSPGWLAAP